jgi:hypothetical protein
MKQKGDNANSLQIGNGGSHNTYNLTQNHQSTITNTQLVVDERTIQEFDAEALRKDQIRGIARLLGSILTGSLGLMSDAIGVSDHFGFHLWWLLPVGAVAGLLLAAPYFRSSEILSKSIQNGKEGNAGVLRNYEIVEQVQNGKIYTYQRIAQCTYPNCTGTIKLTAAPVRERYQLEKPFVGTCSLGGRDHTYRIDHGWVATPEKFDWNPIEPVVQNPQGRRNN